MKMLPSISAAAAFAVLSFSAAWVAPGAAMADGYDVALSVVESAVGPVEDASASPGGVNFRIVSLAQAAQQAKADGDDDAALAKMQEAAALVASSQ